MTSMSARDWDERYRQRELVWGSAPNVWVERETSELRPGRALDIACGEGRNSIWLASRGWQVTGIDFSAEAIRKARELADQVLDHPATVEFRQADATEPLFADKFDLALMVYLQLPAAQRRAAVSAAWSALAPDGKLVVIAHHSDNLAQGVGGPQDPAVLYTAQDVRDDLAAVAGDIELEACDRLERRVADSSAPAIDLLFRARKDHKKSTRTR